MSQGLGLQAHLWGRTADLAGSQEATWPQRPVPLPTRVQLTEAVISVAKDSS